MTNRYKTVSLLVSCFILVSFFMGGCIKLSGFTYFSSSYQGPGSIYGDGENQYSAEVVELENKIKPSVVKVDAETISCDNAGNSVSSFLAGTGWIIGENGLIATNNHIVEGATKVTVTLDNGLSYIAKNIRADKIDDLAVLEIDADDLQPVKLGDSSLLELGERVLAIGNSFGQGIETSLGRISDTGTTFIVDSREILYNTLATTAQITYGYSGGPLINMDGEVIGITSGATLTRTGGQVTSYAICSNDAGMIIQQLIQSGCVTRAWLGVTVCSMDEFQTTGCCCTDKGAYVINVSDGSPAEKAGIKAGDIITDCNGNEIVNADSLVIKLRSCEPDQQIKLTYLHIEKEIITTVILGTG